MALLKQELGAQLYFITLLTFGGGNGRLAATG
jgi:hypothetical protein